MLLPAAKPFVDMIEATIGRDCTIAPADRIMPIDAVGGLIATYWDDKAKNHVAIIFSPEAAAFVGCALALLPPVPAKEMAAERAVRSDVIDNLIEVCNVLSAVFEHPKNPDVRISGTYFPVAQAPAPLANHMFQHFDRVDYELTVENYGSGRVSIVAIG